MSQFFVDLTRQTSFRYDLSALVEYNEEVGMYDESTSYFLNELRKLPSVRTYQIRQPYRPDVYSNDIFGVTDYWLILLIYNDILFIKDLKHLDILNVPDRAAIENIYFNLNARQRAAEASTT